MHLRLKVPTMPSGQTAVRLQTQEDRALVRKCGRRRAIGPPPRSNSAKVADAKRGSLLSAPDRDTPTGRSCEDALTTSAIALTQAPRTAVAAMVPHHTASELHMFHRTPRKDAGIQNSLAG